MNEVKAENKASRDEHGGNSDEVKHWVVCPGGVLKEVKPEHTFGVSEIPPVEDVDQKSYSSSTNHSKMECGSQVKVHERTDTGVKPLTVDTAGADPEGGPRGPDPPFFYNTNPLKAFGLFGLFMLDISSLKYLHDM